VHPTLTWTQLKALGINDGPATFTVKVRVSDGKVGGTVTSSGATLIVTNTAPAGSISGPADVNAGSALSLSFTATDQSPVDQAAGFSYTITWGDGATDGPLHAGSPLSRSHTYAAVGVYTVTMTATDKDGGTRTAATQTVTVGGVKIVTSTCGSGTDLVVGGTSAGDTIKVAPGSSSRSS
jgi:PKD repeat protein